MPSFITMPIHKLYTLLMKSKASKKLPKVIYPLKKQRLKNSSEAPHKVSKPLRPIIDVSSKGEKQQSSVLTNSWSNPRQFGTLAVCQSVRNALVDMGYDSPTMIQKSAIPLIRQGRDLVGQAQTGTGKTAAFGIPIVETMQQKLRHPQALVLTPTRELTIQVAEEITRIGAYRNSKVIAIYGGQKIQQQIKTLQRSVQVIVATPGRLMDHMQRHTISLSNIRIVVLDEADRMLDIGFIDDIEYILRQTPKNRQTLLFSATIPYPIRRLTQRYLKHPKWIRIGGESEPVEQVEQFYYEVAAEDREIALREVLGKNVKQALIFRRTKAGVERLVNHLRRNIHSVQGIHGDMNQSQREKVMSNFKSKKLRLLVATNIAARGLDIPAVSHVINYDMPDNLEDYVHRIGRTARMRRHGTAITFVSQIEDFELLDSLQKHLGDRLVEKKLNLLYN